MGYSDELKARWDKQMQDQGIQGLDALQAFRNQAIANETSWNLFGSTDQASANRWFDESAAGQALQKAQQENKTAQDLENKIQGEAADYQKNMATNTANIAEGSAAQQRRQYAAQKSDIDKQAQARGALYSGQRASQRAGLQGAFAAQQGALQGQAAEAAQGNLQNLQSAAQNAAIARRQLNAGKFSEALDLQKKSQEMADERTNIVGGAVGSALGFGAGMLKKSGGLSGVWGS